MPERARRRSFTAQYKLEVLAAYDAAGPVRRARSCAGRACTPVTSWTGGGPGTAGRWRARRGLAAARPADPRDAQIARLRRRRPSWSRSWPRPASWSMCSQNCRRSWRRSPRARTPSPGRVRDRRGDRPAGAEDRHPGGLRGLRRAAGHLVPAAPDQPAAAAGRSRSRTPSGSSRGRWPRPSGRRSWMRCTAAGSLTWPPTKSGRRCWTRAPTWGRCPPTTGCCARPAKAGSGARRPPTPPPSSPSSSPPGRTRSTPGTSPSCTARRSGPTTTCT